MKPQFDAAGSFKKGLALIKIGGKWSFASKEKFSSAESQRY
ncbi:WG repeat-containing protein [Microcoleus sp. FACHB-1]|nr:WG repeat-containing protein [Microcoleus sp. FACHB-1]